jgi:hypothetical protein
MTLYTCKVDNILLSILTHQTITTPGDLGLSPSITVSTLISYDTYLSLIIFKIIPHSMTLLIAFPLQVIILYLILYRLFSLAYCRITYPLSSSHIPSHHVCLTRRLNPFS